jgi:RNA-directed DNA polymerase
VPAYRAVDAHVYDRVRNFLCRRHNVSRRGTSRFPFGDVFGELCGVASYARAQWTPAVGPTVMPVGKTDAGDQHVRFDERGRETGRSLPSTATASVLDSTVWPHRMGTTKVGSRL